MKFLKKSCKLCQHIAMSVIFDACLGRASIKTPKVRYISLILKIYKSLDIWFISRYYGFSYFFWQECFVCNFNKFYQKSHIFLQPDSCEMPQNTLWSYQNTKIQQSPNICLYYTQITINMRQIAISSFW